MFAPDDPVPSLPLAPASALPLPFESPFLLFSSNFFFSPPSAGTIKVPWSLSAQLRLFSLPRLQTPSVFFYCGLYFQPGIGHVTIIRSPGERQCFLACTTFTSDLRQHGFWWRNLNLFLFLFFLQQQFGTRKNYLFLVCFFPQDTSDCERCRNKKRPTKRKQERETVNRRACLLLSGMSASFISDKESDFRERKYRPKINFFAREKRAEKRVHIYAIP